MASSTEIIARTEKIDKAIRTFSDSLKKFSDETRSHAGKIMGSIKNAGSGWEGETYNAFAEAMEQELVAIKNEAGHAENISQTLDKLAEQISQALELIRKGGN